MKPALANQLGGSSFEARRTYLSWVHALFQYLDVGGIPDTLGSWWTDCLMLLHMIGELKEVLQCWSDEAVI